MDVPQLTEDEMAEIKKDVSKIENWKQKVASINIHSKNVMQAEVDDGFARAVSFVKDL